MALPEAIARSALAGRKQPYSWAWIVSAALHGGIVLALVAVSVVGKSQEPAPTQKPMLVRLGKPRPDHWLPRKPTAPPVPPARKEAPVATPGQQAPVPTPTPTPAPKPEPTPPRPDAKTVPAKATPTAEAPKQQATAPRDAKQDPKAKLDEIMKRFQAGAIAGPAEELPGSPDGHADGDSDRAEGEAYYALLERRVKDQYKLPATISERERLHLNATVRIFIEPNGRITRTELVKGSGNPVFDSALDSAIHRASPVPPPPQHLVRLLQREGVDLNFRP